MADSVARVHVEKKPTCARTDASKDAPYSVQTASKSLKNRRVDRVMLVLSDCSNVQSLVWMMPKNNVKCLKRIIPLGELRRIRRGVLQILVILGDENVFLYP